MARSLRGLIVWLCVALAHINTNPGSRNWWMVGLSIPQQKRLHTQLQTEKTASYDYDFFFSVNAKAMLWNENEASDLVPFELEIGVPQDPMDCLQEAVKVGHSRSMAIHLPENVVKVLETCCNGTLFELAKHGVQYLWHWSNGPRSQSEWSKS